jgi:glycine/D-amino acid oxidase-like deaminating enzyme
MAGKKVGIVGTQENYSSRIAAGLFNPISGKNLSKTWMAKEVFEQLHTFYTKAEQVTQKHFFHPTPIYRPFLSIEEQNEWMGKSASQEWRPFIREVFIGPSQWKGLRDPLGGLLLQQTGYLETTIFLDAVRNFFEKDGHYVCEKFEHAVLQMPENAILYKDWTAEKIIFCEGTDSLHNPLFHWVPVRPLKGETLSVRTALPEDVIINRGVYAVKQQDGSFKIGATYETKDLSPSISEKGKAELEEKFQELFSLPYTVVGQAWGFRPTSPDRRPIIGEHPEQKNALVFNGLGTKGVSLAPFTAGLMTEFLLHGIRSVIYASVDVNRYYSLYWKAVQKT